jgi:hypothetical protein
MKFEATLLPTQRNASERLAAFDKINDDPCAGLAGELGEFSQERLDRLLEQAKAAGDPRASSWLLAREVEGRYHAAQRSRATDPNVPRGYVLSDPEFAEVTGLLRTRDPEVLRDMQGILSSTIHNATILLDGEPVDPRAMNAALTLVACDLGARCGPESPDVLFNCAHRGECGAATVYDHTFFYGASPAQAQMIDGYRNSLLNMFRTGDFSSLGIARGTPNGSSTVYGGRRR